MRAWTWSARCVRRLVKRGAVKRLLPKCGGNHHVYLSGWVFLPRTGGVAAVAATSVPSAVGRAERKGDANVSSCRRKKYYRWERRCRCRFLYLIPTRKNMVNRIDNRLRCGQGRNCGKTVLSDVIRVLLLGREMASDFLRSRSLDDFCFCVFCRYCYCVYWSWWC